MNTASNPQPSSLQMFYNETEGINLRLEIINDEPWFIAKDICYALGLQDVSMTVKRLDEDEKLIQTLFVSGQGRETWTVNESGLYGLIFQSRKPEARAFRKWVTNVVLPSIRRTGSYSASNSVQTPVEDKKNLPLPKFRPFFAEWKEKVKPYIGNPEVMNVAADLCVSTSHVRKVYAGTAVSERVVRSLNGAALHNRDHGVMYPEVRPVYEQLSLEWEKQE